MEYGPGVSFLLGELVVHEGSSLAGVTTQCQLMTRGTWYAFKPPPLRGAAIGVAGAHTALMMWSGRSQQARW